MFCDKRPPISLSYFCLSPLNRNPLLPAPSTVFHFSVNQSTEIELAYEGFGAT